MKITEDPIGMVSGIFSILLLIPLILFIVLLFTGSLTLNFGGNTNKLLSNLGKSREGLTYLFIGICIIMFLVVIGNNFAYTKKCHKCPECICSIDTDGLSNCPTCPVYSECPTCAPYETDAPTTPYPTTSAPYETDAPTTPYPTTSAP